MTAADLVGAQPTIKQPLRAQVAPLFLAAMHESLNASLPALAAPGRQHG